jgi:hypothetical protein
LVPPENVTEETHDKDFADNCFHLSFKPIVVYYPPEPQKHKPQKGVFANVLSSLNQICLVLACCCSAPGHEGMRLQMPV